MNDVIAEQARYYRERAPEYDEWFMREGRYERGAALNARWFVEVEEVRGWLRALGPLGDVLELAAGTGIWTRLLVERATSVTCIDASPEALDLNRRRLANDARVAYEVADLFAWRPLRRWRSVFMGFWLSHVPADRQADFWSLVSAAIEPEGRVLVVDSLPDPGSTAVDHKIELGGQVTRRLNDGREFRIVKRFIDALGLTRELEPSGWRVNAHRTPSFFLYAELSRPEAH